MTYRLRAHLLALSALTLPIGAFAQEAALSGPPRYWSQPT